MNFGQPKPQIQREEKQKCRLKLKKTPDGGVIKEVQGCTKEELKALSEIPDDSYA